MLKTLTIEAGHGKDGKPETFSSMTLLPGNLYAVAGNTGAGKSRFIKDIEQLADGDSVTGRKIRINGAAVPKEKRLSLSASLVAHLSQNMRFVLDLTVRDFLALHCRCREKKTDGLSSLLEDIIRTANTITPEPIRLTDSLNLLSGGQSRALMAADIAMVCESPIVLIDEIENAGINKKAALQLLADQKKLVLLVTHDPHTALMAKERILIKNGAVFARKTRTKEEETLFLALDRQYEDTMRLQSRLRKGENLI